MSASFRRESKGAGSGACMTASNGPTWFPRCLQMTSGCVYMSVLVCVPGQGGVGMILQQAGREVVVKKLAAGRARE